MLGRDQIQWGIAQLILATLYDVDFNRLKVDVSCLESILLLFFQGLDCLWLLTLSWALRSPLESFTKTSSRTIFFLLALQKLRLILFQKDWNQIESFFYLVHGQHWSDKVKKRKPNRLKPRGSNSSPKDDLLGRFASDPRNPSKGTFRSTIYSWSVFEGFTLKPLIGKPNRLNPALVWVVHPLRLRVIVIKGIKLKQTKGSFNNWPQRRILERNGNLLEGRNRPQQSLELLDGRRIASLSPEEWQNKRVSQMTEWKVGKEVNDHSRRKMGLELKKPKPPRWLIVKWIWLVACLL